MSESRGRERGTEIDAAAQARAGIETTQAPQGDQERSSLIVTVTEVVAGGVAGNAAWDATKLAAGAVVDKVSGHTGGAHKAEKGD
jgi:hypothetical protein